MPMDAPFGTLSRCIDCGNSELQEIITPSLQMINVCMDTSLTHRREKLLNVAHGHQQ